MIIDSHCHLDNEKLETLNKQSEELRIMYLKVQGAIELTNAMIEEENFFVV